jgi:hypothetical protein
MSNDSGFTRGFFYLLEITLLLEEVKEGIKSISYYQQNGYPPSKYADVQKATKDGIARLHSWASDFKPEAGELGKQYHDVALHFTTTVNSLEDKLNLLL